MSRSFYTLAVVLASLFGCSDSRSSEQQPVERILREFRNPKSKHVMVIAHRGGWRHARVYNARENSLPNVDKAVRLGYDVFETDVSGIKDGHWVLMHDPSVKHRSRNKWRISVVG